jgi:hypothetical protein
MCMSYNDVRIFLFTNQILITMKLSTFCIKLIVFGLVSAFISVITMNTNAPGVSAVFAVLAFVFLWGSSMLPEEEKFKQD